MDRRYSVGHLWFQSREDATPDRLRVGFDAFAAQLTGTCRRVRYGVVPRDLGASQSLCELELEQGVLKLGAAMPCRMLHRNDAVEDRPDLAMTDPYGDGWLAEIVPRGRRPLDRLLEAEEARLRVHQDVRRFRRLAAVRLLAEAAATGPCLADGGERLTDLRQMLGPRSFLELLRELIH